MSKPIINGIDVSECRHYHYKGCSARGTKCDFESSNCYYKQLKRLAKENTELKQALEEIREYCSKFQRDLGQTDMLCIEIINKINEVLND